MENLSTTTDAPCPLTHTDLLFWCFFMLVPTTATFCYFWWRHQVDKELVVAYSNQGSTIQGRVLQKHAKLHKEFRGDAFVHAFVENQAIEEYEIKPFFLNVQYDVSGSTVAKQVEVSEQFYQSINVGDHVELRYVPGYDDSAIVLDDQWQQDSSDISLVAFCAFLCLLAMGTCAMNACVKFGWFIILGFQIVTFVPLWWYLNHNHRDGLLDTALCKPLKY